MDNWGFNKNSYIREEIEHFIQYYLSHIQFYRYVKILLALLILFPYISLNAQSNYDLTLLLGINKTIFNKSDSFAESGFSLGNQYESEYSNFGNKFGFRLGLEKENQIIKNTRIKTGVSINYIQFDVDRIYEKHESMGLLISESIGFSKHRELSLALNALFSIGILKDKIEIAIGPYIQLSSLMFRNSQSSKTKYYISNNDPTMNGFWTELSQPEIVESKRMDSSQISLGYQFRISYQIKRNYKLAIMYQSNFIERMYGQRIEMFEMQIAKIL